ncbi:MAG: hypothetical protein BWY78_00654 [Alphaproteobacteria bacterium ADurb.Bin438]|nr:MAG: hypothetical protein BWY78_00654 [Alphaproteobacteria bacterium ADurb.Bin438]
MRKIFFIFTLFLISACYYTPDNFVANVIVDDKGAFSMVYEGDLVRVSYVKELLEGKVKPEDIREKIEIIKRDLEKEKSFSEVVSMGQGRFKVKYKKTGYIGPGKIHSFIRRDSIIFSLKSTPEENDYEVFFAGRYLTPDKQKQLLDLGVHINGIFRFATNGKVVEHNAMRVIKNSNEFGGGMIYEWVIKDFEYPTPHLVMKLKNKR